METETQLKKRHKEMMIIAAAIVFLFVVLLVWGVNSRAEAAVGFCKQVQAADSASLYEYGNEVKMCPTYSCYSSLQSDLAVAGWALQENSQFNMFDGGVYGERWWKGTYLTLVYDVNGVGGFIGEGCSSENTFVNDLLSWWLYVLTGVMFAWAFIKAIHTVNS